MAIETAKLRRRLGKPLTGTTSGTGWPSCWPRASPIRWSCLMAVPPTTQAMCSRDSALRLTAEHSRSVRRAVRFLRRTQHPRTGLWEGRWGINTLYGTTQAGIGLLRAGESPQLPYLLTAARTLMSFQNADGGFGESTLSYLDAGHHGRGISTRPKPPGCSSFSAK